MSRSINGPLLEALAESTQFADAVCVNSFRKGAPLMDKLAFAGERLYMMEWVCNAVVLLVPGNGPAKKFPDHKSIQRLHESRAERNVQTLKRVREDVHSNELLQKTLGDAEEGRMSPPEPFSRRQSSGTEAELLTSRCEAHAQLAVCRPLLHNVFKVRS